MVGWKGFGFQPADGWLVGWLEGDGWKGCGKDFFFDVFLTLARADTMNKVNKDVK